MTQSTEQERALFEAWRIGELRKAIGRPVHLQSDDDLRRVFLRLNGSGQYADNQEQQRFEAWQAARRAQVVPAFQADAARRTSDWPQFEQCQDAFDVAKKRHPDGSPTGGNSDWHWFQLGWNSQALVACNPSMQPELATKPQEEVPAFARNVDGNDSATQEQMEMGAEVSPVQLPAPDAYVFVRISPVEAVGATLMGRKNVYFDETVRHLLATKTHDA